MKNIKRKKKVELVDYAVHELKWDLATCCQLTRSELIEAIECGDEPTPIWMQDQEPDSSEPQAISYPDADGYAPTADRGYVDYPEEKQRKRAKSEDPITNAFAEIRRTRSTMQNLRCGAVRNTVGTIEENALWAIEEKGWAGIVFTLKGRENKGSIYVAGVSATALDDMILELKVAGVEFDKVFPEHDGDYILAELKVA